MKRRATLSQQNIIIVAVIVIIAIAGIYYFTRPKGEETPPVENLPPIVVATSTKTYVQVGDSVEFSAKGSIDTDGTIIKYDWILGDGETGTGEVLNHIYQLPGDYLIILNATDDKGASKTNNVSPINVKVERVPISPTLESPPIAIIGISDSVVDINDIILYDGISSYGWRSHSTGPQPDITKIVSWSWDFGDGGTSDKANVTHSYNLAGNYYITLKVQDATGNTDTVARTILVVPTGTEYEGVIKNPDTFVFASSANIPSSLDLYDITSPTSGRQMCLVLADTLLFQDQGEVEPTTKRGLAESYEISSDGLQYTFNLRQGVKFWNGDELTAEDVEYTFERILALTAAKLEWSVTFERMTGMSRVDVASGTPVPREVIDNAVEVVDSYTVRFNFAEAYAPFLRSLTNTGWGIIQKDYAIENGAWSWNNPTDYSAIDGVDKPMEDGEALMCTGPYKITEWSKGERILFERHVDYWEKTPSIEYVRYFSVPEFSTRKILIENGDVDGLSISAVTEFEQLLGRPGINTVVSKYRGFLEAVGLGINFDPTLAPPQNQVPSDFFADVHMRRAFAYALPYERYVEEVWLGYAEPARGVLPLGWPGAFESYPYTYDLEKAAEELQLAHDGKYWEEGFQVCGGHQAWAENTHAILYRMWAEEFAKIDPKFKVMSVSARYGDMMRMPIGMWIGVIDMDPIAYRSYTHSEGWSSYYGYNNPEVDRLIDASTYTPFMEERLPLLKEASDIAADEVPFLFTVHPAFLGAFGNYIDGFWYPIDPVVDAGYWPDLTKGQ